MIERAIRAWLLADDAVRNVLEGRVYVGFAPAAVTGPYLIINRIAYQREYHLRNECDVAIATLQFDAYESTQSKAWELFELIRNRLSGYFGEMSYLDADGTESIYAIHSATILRDDMQFTAPQDASDRWTIAYSSDWRISHTQAEPNHTGE